MSQTHIKKIEMPKIIQAHQPDHTPSNTNLAGTQLSSSSTASSSSDRRRVNANAGCGVIPNQLYNSSRIIMKLAR